MPECQAAVPSAHCAQPWCYVDPALCRGSSTIYERSAYFPDVDNLFFSYQTCGGDGTDFASYERILEAATQTSQLTVVLPTDTYEPYHYKQGAAGEATEFSHYRNDAVPWEGILVEFLSKLADHPFPSALQPSFNLTWTSVASRTAHSSAWSAAVNDVALGIADMGCSLFWMTADRLEKAAFTANIATDMFYLWVPVLKHADTSLLVKMGRVFEPFDWQVWMAVVLIIFGLGTLQVWLTQRLWWDEWTGRVEWEAAGGAKRAALLLSRISEGWYDSYMGVATGSPVMHDEHRLATRLLNAGSAFFIVLFLSAYTANLAAFLSKPEEVQVWRDIEAATDAKAKICVDVVLEKTLSRRFPRTDFRYRYMYGADDVREALTTDGCDAFIMEMRAMRVGSSVDAVRCEFGLYAVGASVAELDVAMPAQAETAHLMTYFMKTLADENGTTYSTVQARHEKPPLCPLYPEVRLGSAELTPLGLVNFAAPLLIVAVSMALAVATRLMRHTVRQAQEVDLRASLDANGDGVFDEADLAALRTKGSRLARLAAWLLASRGKRGARVRSAGSLAGTKGPTDVGTAQLDTDGDGKVSIAEQVEALSRDAVATPPGSEAVAVSDVDSRDAHERSLQAIEQSMQAIAAHLKLLKKNQ